MFNDVLYLDAAALMRVFLTVTLVIMLVGLQFRLWTGEGSLAHVHQLEQKLSVQKANNERLSERNDRLAASVVDFRLGMDGVEERARHELGMIRKGETFFLVMQ